MLYSKVIFNYLTGQDNTGEIFIHTRHLWVKTSQHFLFYLSGQNIFGNIFVKEMSIRTQPTHLYLVIK